MKTQLFKIVMFTLIFVYVYSIEHDIRLSLIAALFLIGLSEIIVSVVSLLIQGLIWSYNQLYSSKTDNK